MRDLPFIERNTRRARVYSRRFFRSAANRELNYNCCYYHIPKCGGTSLSEALHAVIPMHQHIGQAPANTTRRAAAIYFANRDDELAFADDGEQGASVYALREQMLLAFMAHDDALVHGHFLFSHKADRHFGDRYKYVTMLRNPIDRVISNYRGAKRDGNTTLPFGEYLDSFLGRSHATHNLRYFSGRPHVAISDEAPAIDAAKAVINKFSIIGFVDEMATFVEQFERLFGARLSIGQYNVGKNERPDIAPADYAKLKAACAADLELHHYAQSVMRSQQSENKDSAMEAA
ncbi:MAG: sulfotransferase family 2 domain-containing protein [Pseudomonadota bacterium]